MAAASRTPRLRRADCTGPGIRRVRHGRGFRYVDPDGDAVADDEIVARIHELVIPPAWQEVWICPYPGGHIQATGVDQAGRKQYLYHPRWRERRDQAKFDDMVRFARALPALRERVDDALESGELSREHVLAVAVRLLDRGFFRIGSEDYAVRNETYGLATMKKCHVHLNGDVLPVIADCVALLKRRRGGGDDLLAYKRGRRWVDVKSADINEFLKDATDLEISAKDFRTWGATVLAAVALAVSGQASGTKTGRRRAITRAVNEVAHYLGNTPAVARASYIDPRVFDRFREGRAIDSALVAAAGEAAEGTAIQGPVEEAVLDLLD